MAAAAPADHLPGTQRASASELVKEPVPFSAGQIADVAASFQAAVVDVLRIKLRRAAKATGAKTLIIGGGVSANSALRAAAVQLAEKLRCTLRMPQIQFCVDNAAMTAGLAYHYLQAGKTDGLDLTAHATVRR